MMIVYSSVEIQTEGRQLRVDCSYFWAILQPLNFIQEIWRKLCTAFCQMRHVVCLKEETSVTIHLFLPFSILIAIVYIECTL